MHLPKGGSYLVAVLESSPGVCFDIISLWNLVIVGQAPVVHLGEIDDVLYMYVRMWLEVLTHGHRGYLRITTMVQEKCVKVSIIFL